MNEAERLNADCNAARLNQGALQQAEKAQGEAWHSLVTERCPYLFADVPVFISPVQLRKMYEVIAAVEQVVGLAGWQETGQERKPNAKSVFFGYDFHLNEQGVHLIEINTNAGGALLNELLINSQRDAGLPGKAVAIEHLEQSFLAMFCNEWRLERGSAPLRNIAIVDEKPEEQYLYPEFLLAKAMLERAGIAVYIADPVSFQAREDGLYFGHEKIDMVYNRLTDFSLQRYPALLHTYSNGKAVLTPHPHAYAKYADKRNLARLSDADGLRALGASEADITVLMSGVPRTFIVQSRHGGAQHSDETTSHSTRPSKNADQVAGYGAGGTASQLLPQSAGSAITNDLASVVGSPSRMASSSISNVSQLQPDMEETLWAERKDLFFKPNSGYGSRGAYRGGNLTKRVYAEILQGDYVAQKLAPPGERAVCVHDAEPTLLKYDVRCYVYDGQIQLVAARLYQGQTTNFRTPGGGFALVRVVD